MNHNHVFGKVHPLLIFLVAPQKSVPRGLCQFVIAALERIMEGFGNLEEIISPRDDFPAGLDLEFIQQRHQLVEHFGDPTTYRCGVDHFHRLAF
jgi:hypothetical protein